MFIFLNQLKSEDPICIDVANIREFHPETVKIEEVERTGTLIILYRGESWLVKQPCYNVYELCQAAKLGGL